MKKKIIPVLVAIALIILVGGGAIGVQLYDKYFGYSN